MNREREGGTRGNPSQSKFRSERSYSGPSKPKQRPGSYTKGGKAYLGKLEKLKAKKNYTLKVKSKFAKQMKRATSHTNSEDAAFFQVPEFYKEIFAEVDHKDTDKKSQKKRSGPSRGMKYQNANQGSNKGPSGSFEQQRSQAFEDPSKSSVAQKKDALPSAEVDRLPQPEAADQASKPDLANVNIRDVVNKRENKKHKPNPFKKTLEELEQQQKELERIRQDAALEAKKRQKEIQKKQRQRKLQNKRLTQKTKLGQPVLGNYINHMLAKLEKS